MVLLSLVLPWQAMRGETGEVDATLAALETVVGSLGLPMAGDALATGHGLRMLWSGRPGDFADLLRDLGPAGDLPMDSITAAMLCRAGRHEEARAHLADHPVDLDHDGWFSPLVWACAAEAAAALGEPATAAAAYALLSPLAGRPAGTGSAAALGPVDAALALGAAAVGETDLAEDHARDARRLCARWRTPLVLDWFEAAYAEALARAPRP